MNSVCISNCINDARDPRVPVRPVRATYVSLYRWPESDAEFVRSVRRCGVPSRRVVDTISCRQMYLRSYKFSRDDDEERNKTTAATQKCFGKVKETASLRWRKEEESSDVIMDRAKRRRKKEEERSNKRKKRVSHCSALFRFFHRLLTCAATVDVVDPK